jgi:hypothetical protein
MGSVLRGRFTDEADEPVVVFLIGMRINRLWALGRWVPAFLAMSKMLSSLKADPAKGFLGGRTFVHWRGIMMVQYWRSFEDLEGFARAESEPHIGSWRKYNKAVGSDGTVGVWHETYLVRPSDHESVYVNMPEFGLAEATDHVPAVRSRETARMRLGGSNAPAVDLRQHAKGAG